VPGTTVRIREETRAVLRELEEQTGERTQDLLARAVDQFRRNLILAETNAAYGRIRAEASDEFDAEIREWDVVLTDGRE
jgi:hypothetical protein